MSSQQQRRRKALIEWSAATIALFVVLLALAYGDVNFLRWGSEFSVRTVAVVVLVTAIIAPFIWMYIRSRYSASDKR